MSLDLGTWCLCIAWWCCDGGEEGIGHGCSIGDGSGGDRMFHVGGGGGGDAVKNMVKVVAENGGGEMMENGTVGGHPTVDIRNSDGVKLHAHQRRSGSNHRSWCRTLRKPRALIPTDVTERKEPDITGLTRKDSQIHLKETPQGEKPSNWRGNSSLVFNCQNIQSLLNTIVKWLFIVHL
ncbi:hypothetical protein L484_021966 [Morus notabilis]|uniref:Uncharacterized protein n=1 Tax=Morus notabilis TaxID=981085 RepID=W9QXF7_9ROSA|nr:hypothetical protein L484_021966 [Morus notabilis]